MIFKTTLHVDAQRPSPLLFGAMCPIEILRDIDRKPIEGRERPIAPPAPHFPQLVKAEANLLRLPLFALHTKGLKTLDGLECRGRIARDGQAHQFLFRATRNTATSYPGPLARSAHLAFLSIITETGLPHRDPLTWTWRDLCRRMGVTYGGQMVRHLKEAITATAALLLHSEYAVYDKPGGNLLSTQHEALHLYERVAFAGTSLPDGTIADGNYLWLSDWYRDNLNALFTAPLDYPLWQHLDQRSPIASRLYEFLLLNLYNGAPVFRINYETLVQFLPIKAERYRSSAQRQLGQPFQLLTDNGVLHRAEWADSQSGIALLHLFRGEKLPASSLHKLVAPTNPDIASMAVSELRNLKRPEWGLVADFYHQWGAAFFPRPTPRELALAREIVSTHGETKAKRLIPLIVKKLKSAWPEAKTFGALAKYVPEVSEEYDRLEHISQKQKEEHLRQITEHKEQQVTRDAQQRLIDSWRFAWESLADADREGIAATIRQKWPHVARVPKMFERYCILELAHSRSPNEAA